MTREDLFPTRHDQHHDRFPRLDPVVHARNQARWEGPLDEVALSHYERDGFLWFEGFFSQERMRPFFDELKEMAKDTELMKSDKSITDPESGDLRSVFQMHEISRRFDELTRDPRILGMVRQLLGGDVYIHQSRINDKFGFQGSGFNWHSDFETWHSEDGMPRMRAISASIMLTDNNEFNGPLMLIPGSHKAFLTCIGETPDDHYRQSLKKQEYGVPDEDSLAELAHKHGIVAPTGKPGSVVIFDCNTMHGSNGNITPFPRANAFMVYNAVSNRLTAPFGVDKPRPEFIAARGEPEAITPVTGLLMEEALA